MCNWTGSFATNPVKFFFAHCQLFSKILSPCHTRSTDVHRKKIRIQLKNTRNLYSHAPQLWPKTYFVVECPPPPHPFTKYHRYFQALFTSESDANAAIGHVILTKTNWPATSPSSIVPTISLLCTSPPPAIPLSPPPYHTQCPSNVYAPRITAPSKLDISQWQSLVRSLQSLWFWSMH